MEALQGKSTGQEDIMKKLQSQMGEQAPGGKAQDQMKRARNNISPFSQKDKSPTEQSSSIELPQGIIDASEKIIKAPVEIVKQIPKVVFDSTRPILAQGDDSFESLALNWKAKIKGFFSGIGGFFKSVFNSKPNKK